MAKKVEITTSSGFKWKIDPDLGNDMEFIDKFQSIITGTAEFVPGEFLAELLGEEGKKALYEHHRNPKTGRVEADKVGPDIGEIMNLAAKASKK